MQFALPRSVMKKILMEQGRTEAEAIAQLNRDAAAVALSSKIFAQKVAKLGLKKVNGGYRCRFDDDNDPVFKALAEAAEEADAIIDAL